MKKLYSIAVAAVLAVSGLNAKTLDQARIYINPGHGGWGPNDRPCATIPYPNLPSTGRPDTCGFYESNTNLWKCLKMGATLEKMGAKKANIMYSRVKNGPFPDVPNSDMGEFNRPLTEICEEVEANNMDYFISVHSNSAGEGVIANYPLILFRGKDVGDNYAPGSYNMAQTLWPIIFHNDIDPKTYYGPDSPNIRGDISFYGSQSSRTDPNSGKTYTGYLGVLKHGTPGYLCEGYFHSYQPARHRALNPDYCYQEGVRYARAIAEYFGSNGESTGYIMGTVKDKHERFSHALYKYKSGSNDQWKPLNGTVVNLYKGGSKVASYTVDNNYNGVFVFENLQPGEYTLDCNLAGYKPLAAEYKKPITVKANETAYPMVFLENENYTPSEFSSENYPDPVQPDGIILPERFELEKEYNKSYDIAGTVTRMITRGDYTVVLSHESNGTPHLYLINNKVRVIITMSTNGIIQKDTQNAGFHSTLSDIAITADGKLIGCNRIRCQFSDGQVDAGYKRGEVTIYKWDTFFSNPKAWLSTNSSANYYRADIGHTIGVSGSSDECKIILSGMTSGDSKSIRWVILDIVKSKLASTIFTEKTVNSTSNFTLSKLGQDFKVMVSPRANDQFIVDGANTTPFEFKLPTSNNTDSPIIGRMSASNINAKANGASYFKYAKHALMAAPTADGNGKSTGVKLFDISDGLDNAQLVETTNTNISSTANASNSFAATVVDQDYINIYLGQNKRVTKVTDAPNVAIMATNLDFVEQVDKHTFTFDANDDPVDAEILFYELDGKFSHKVKMPDVKKGHNEFTIPKDRLPLYGLTWEIRLVGKPIHSMTLYKEIDRAGHGIVVDNSTESNYFGRYYVCEKKERSNNNWMYCFDTNGNQTFGAQKTEMGIAGRLAINGNGTVFVPDWSDAKSGIWLFDPANPGKTCPNFFKGSRGGNGTFTNNGVKVGCSSTGVAIYGEGEEAKLYMHAEDFGPNGGNDIMIYNIGNSTSWNKAPSKQVKTGHVEINGSCCIVPDETGGFWLSQVRFAPQNTSDVPSLIYVNSSGDILYNSGISAKNILSSTKNGGFQISPDGKVLIANEDVNGVVKLFNINWSNGTPSLSLKSSFISYDNTFQMAWDLAGNLYTIGKSLKIYSYPKENNECTTAAQKSKVIQGTSSVDENSIEEIKVEIYPNPVTDVMNINTNQEIESVKIFSATGALMIDTQEKSIDVSGLTSGVYLVKVNGTKVIRVIKK